ncbi:hypothetical protein [Herpetosiphon sp. NSE202]|uniref:hypothetical protein n=1 Tax=Herpetosiphon sp. NSE202 TaxID=3351349 RepID=UPI00363571D7
MQQLLQRILMLSLLVIVGSCGMTTEPTSITNPALPVYAQTKPDSFILKRGVPPSEFQPGVWLHLSSFRRGETTAIIEVSPQQFEVAGKKQTVSLEQPLLINGQKFAILAMIFPDDRGAWLEIDTQPQP